MKNVHAHSIENESKQGQCPNKIELEFQIEKENEININR
jgi:hypothetical protein